MGASLMNGWMIGVLQPFQCHRSYQASMLMKKNYRYGCNTPFNIFPGPEQNQLKLGPLEVNFLHVQYVSVYACDN